MSENQRSDSSEDKSLVGISYLSVAQALTVRSRIRAINKAFHRKSLQSIIFGPKLFSLLKTVLYRNAFI